MFLRPLQLIFLFENFKFIFLSPLPSSLVVYLTYWTYSIFVLFFCLFVYLNL